jgi:hypothetical protein
MAGTQVNLAIVLLSESSICCHMIVEKLNLELFNFLHICCIFMSTDCLPWSCWAVEFSQRLLKFAVSWGSSVCVDLHNVKDVLLVPAWVKQIQCTPFLHVSRPILILSSQLYLGFSSDVFYKNFCGCILCLSQCATIPLHPTQLEFIIPNSEMDSFVRFSLSELLNRTCS